MSIKQAAKWTLVFALLLSTTYYIVRPDDTNETIAYAKSKNEKVLVMNYSAEDEVEGVEAPKESKFSKLMSKFVKKDMVCSITADQYDDLKNQYPGATVETLNIDGEDMSFVKIPKTEASAGKILKSLKGEDKGSLHCTVRPSQSSWYISLLGGGVS